MQNGINYSKLLDNCDLIYLLFRMEYKYSKLLDSGKLPKSETCALEDSDELSGLEDSDDDKVVFTRKKKKKKVCCYIFYDYFIIVLVFLT